MSSSATPRSETVPKVSAALALTLLVLINLFNYIDRQVLAAVEPEIRKELLPDDSATPRLQADGRPEESEDAKFWMGWLATAFLLSYMIFAPLFGVFADRFCAGDWWVSASSFGRSRAAFQDSTGRVGDLRSRLLDAAADAAGCFVGVGEAAYGPVAPAMIADLFPGRPGRGNVMSWFYLAIPVGGALGYALGGGIVKLTGEWRWAFFSVVPPGLILGIWCCLMRDPPHRQRRR